MEANSECFYTEMIIWSYQIRNIYKCKNNKKSINQYTKYNLSVMECYRNGSPLVRSSLMPTHIQTYLQTDLTKDETFPRPLKCGLPV